MSKNCLIYPDASRFWQIVEKYGVTIFYTAPTAITARKAKELGEAEAHLKSLGIEVQTCPCDLSDPSVPKPLVDQVMGKWGRIDILVNNAGTTWGAPMEDHPLEAWQKVLNLNLTAMFLLTQAVGKATMIPRRTGRLINIASIAGLSGTEPAFMSTIGYNTTKAGVINSIIMRCYFAQVRNPAHTSRLSGV